jgi:lambda repressor-like predicted transcriptional regulator
MTRDPFIQIRKLTLRREEAEYEWRHEVAALRALGFSTRAIAQVAGVSHDTIWKLTR